MKILIILFALAVLVYVIVRPFLKANMSKRERESQENQGNIEEMCQCAHCGVYASCTESILSNGLYFCSKECLKKGAK